jgi:hypothetical protein
MATGIKTGGRTKGTPNKTTSEIREHYQRLITDNIDLLDNDLKALEPVQRLKMIIELSKFVLPTLKATELSNSDNDNRFQPIVVNIVSEDEITRIKNELESKY